MIIFLVYSYSYILVTLKLQFKIFLVFSKLFLIIDLLFTQCYNIIIINSSFHLLLFSQIFRFFSTLVFLFYSFSDHHFCTPVDIIQLLIFFIPNFFCFFSFLFFFNLNFFKIWSLFSLISFDFLKKNSCVCDRSSTFLAFIFFHFLFFNVFF